METYTVILFVAAGLLGLYLAWAALSGAIFLLAFASEQGFIGLSVYIVLWVFLFPAMLVISTIIGLFTMWGR